MTKGNCQCGREACVDGMGNPGRFGTLGKADKNGRQHVRGCADSGCDVCRGRRNRRGGLEKQRTARKQLGVKPNKFGDSNEERWESQFFADEVKSGKVVSPVLTWWLKASTQIAANQVDHGGLRKYPRVTLMPEGWGDKGLVVVELEAWRTLVAPALEEFYGSAS